MTHRSCLPLRRALAAALLVSAAACADQPTTPAAPDAAGIRRTTGDGAALSAKPVLHPNRTPYRYNGRRPGGGRSGNASLSMHALLDRDGNTEVELSTGQLDDLWPYTPGTITRVQSRATSPDGKHMFTHTDNQLSAYGRVTLAVPRLPLGAVVQVQANVADIDLNRTDVVTATSNVLRRPNLAVVEVNAPSRVRTGTLINVSALIRETNGDVGNRGTCSLYADGVQVDWARWIWVDAGDAVGCVFTHRLQRAGPVRMEVRIDIPSGALRDDYDGDNVAEAIVEGIVTNEILYSVEARELVYRDTSSTYTRYFALNGPGETVWQNENADYKHEQSVRMNGMIPKLLSANPLRVEIAEMTGGATIVARTLDVGAPGRRSLWWTELRLRVGR